MMRMRNRITSSAVKHQAFLAQVVAVGPEVVA